MVGHGETVRPQHPQAILSWEDAAPLVLGSIDMLCQIVDSPEAPDDVRISAAKAVLDLGRSGTLMALEERLASLEAALGLGAHKGK